MTSRRAQNLQSRSRREACSASSRREFIQQIGVVVSLSAAHVLPGSLQRTTEIGQRSAVRNGRAPHITILHTADIHAQLDVHDEFFWENGRAAFKRRGGFAALRTMINALRSQNPGNTLVVDGGDCIQGSGVASLSKGQAIVPLVNAIGYDLVVPGNWEVVYGKDMMIADLNGYSAAKVCANMFHADAPAASPIFPPFQTFTIGGVKVGFVGYTDPLTPTRQSPAYSRGIRFTHPCSLSLEREKAHSAISRNTVVGRPGRIAPSAASPTDVSPTTR